MASMDFPIMVSYSQLAVFDPSLERPFNEWTRGHVAQGVSWRPGSVSFRTIQEGGRHLIMVSVEANQVEPEPAVIRAIDVPFEVPPGGAVEIGSISESTLFELPPGLYQLRFECYGRANSETPRVRFVFCRDDDPVFRLLRVDSDLHPSKDLLLTALPA
jgi:hypothetical protein